MLRAGGCRSHVEPRRKLTLDAAELSTVGRWTKLSVETANDAKEEGGRLGV
jgi:hypothetical protein